jgi:5-(aminomethyl)-3-furanmethanol phosphate kinase
VIVVKVGGSLYDHPGLGPGLNRFLGPLLRAGSVWLVPGGGAAADVVRRWDRVHALGEEVAHWVALRSLSLTALFLASFLNEATIVGEGIELGGEGLSIIDPYDFTFRDDCRPGSLPRLWAVTSDSIAARAAVVGKAEKLVLLKSIDIPPGTPWETAAANGWVDEYFPRVVAGTGLRVEAVNFRRWLDQLEEGQPAGRVEPGRSP